MRVAAGAIAKKYLSEKQDINIKGYLSQIGPIKIKNIDLTQVDKNPFFCPDSDVLEEIEGLIDNLRKEGDSTGAKIEVTVSNMPIGLGEPVFDKLEADLAKGLMSINAVKGFEIGKGFDLIASKGSDSRDEMSPEGYLSNNSGGISGGISTGQDINLSIALKPTSSINKEGKTIDTSGESQEIQVKGRHDPCVGVRATPIAEAMTALVVMDHFLRNRAQNADVITDIPDYS
jgi:chorismate synthase